MENLLFERIITNYHQYAKQFYSTPELLLKYKHSENVAFIAKQISEYVTPSKSLHQLIEIAALYHDIGRYTQFEKYQTFNDSLSENHAQSGADVILELGLIDGLDPLEKNIILDVVKNHNKKIIDESLDDVTTLVCNVVRDSDKIDILKLLADYYQSDSYNSSLSLNLPENDTYNPLIVQDLISAKSIDFSAMNSLNDFRLVNLSWVYDLNFAISHLLVYNSHVLSVIYNSITVKSTEIDLAYHMVDGICEAYSH